MITTKHFKRKEGTGNRGGDLRNHDVAAIGRVETAVLGHGLGSAADRCNDLKETIYQKNNYNQNIK